MKKTFFVIILLACASSLLVSQGFTLEKKTHEYISQIIGRGTINGFSLSSYLKENLGFKDGAEELLDGYSEKLRVQVKQQAFQWIGEGGYMEDVPEQRWRLVLNIARNNNHFHNPLAPSWPSAGLNQRPPLIPWRYTGESSILWAQNPNQNPGGTWSWHDARDYFYKGLTLTDKTRRESAMGNCFKALGQLMHLVHDASVPAHIRNQIHIGFHYETWVEKIRTGNADERALFGQLGRSWGRTEASFRFYESMNKNRG